VKTTVKKVTVGKTQGGVAGVVGVRGPATSASSGRTGEALVLFAFGLAILCFAVAAVPSASVPSRVSYYVVPHKTDLTLLGVILLATAGVAILLTRGP
jgi:hypothetical protein